MTFRLIIVKSRSLYHVWSLGYSGSCHKADCIAIFSSLNLIILLNTGTHIDKCYIPALLIDFNNFFIHCFSGQLITTAEQTFIKQCMKCLFDESSPLPDCQYVFCNVNLTSGVFCSKVQ